MVNGIVMGVSAGDVSKCVVRWKTSTSDQHIDLPMSRRKLNNLFYPTCEGSRASGSASKKARIDENSAGPSSVVYVIESCSSSSDDDDEIEDEESMGVDGSMHTGVGVSFIVNQLIMGPRVFRRQDIYDIHCYFCMNLI